MSLSVLGDGGEDSIVFEVNKDKVMTWQELRRSGEARWAEHEVYAGKPVKEFLGPGLEQLELDVRLDLGRGVVPRDKLRLLRKLRDTGAVSQFTVGGSLVGDFVVRALKEIPKFFSPKGVLMVGMVNITLEEYV
jgi:phage protein U